MRCPSCGYQNEGTNKFCNHCGKQLELKSENQDLSGAFDFGELLDGLEDLSDAKPKSDKASMPDGRLDLSDLALDLPDIDIPGEPIEEKVAPAKKSTDKKEETAGLDDPGLDLDLGTLDDSEESSFSEPTKEPASDSFELDIGSLGLEDLGDSGAAAPKQAEDEVDLDFDLGDLSLDEAPAPTPSAEVSAPSTETQPQADDADFDLDLDDLKLEDIQETVAEDSHVELPAEMPAEPVAMAPSEPAPVETKSEDLDLDELNIDGMFADEESKAVELTEESQPQTPELELDGLDFEITDEAPVESPLADSVELDTVGLQDEAPADAGKEKPQAEEKEPEISLDLDDLDAPVSIDDSDIELPDEEFSLDGLDLAMDDSSPAEVETALEEPAPEVVKEDSEALDLNGLFDEEPESDATKDVSEEEEKTLEAPLDLNFLEDEADGPGEQEKDEPLTEQPVDEPVAVEDTAELTLDLPDVAEAVTETIELPDMGDETSVPVAEEIEATEVKVESEVSLDTLDITDSADALVTEDSLAVEESITVDEVTEDLEVSDVQLDLDTLPQVEETVPSVAEIDEPDVSETEADIEESMDASEEVKILQALGDLPEPEDVVEMPEVSLGEEDITEEVAVEIEEIEEIEDVSEDVFVDDAEVEEEPLSDEEREELIATVEAGQEKEEPAQEVPLVLENMSADTRLEYLSEQLKHVQTEDEKYRVVLDMSRYRDERMKDTFIELLDEADDIKEIAVESLGKLKAFEAITPIIKILDESYIELSYICARALGEIGEVTATQSLINYIQHEDPDLAYIAIESIGKIGDTGALSALAEVSKSDNPDLRYIVAEALGNLLDEDVVTPLLELIKDDVHEVKVRAIKSLGKIGSAKAVSHLLICLHEQNLETK
ncbi:HEAT repeat domain-containing protein, partial [Candidatus Riflebacteria bacterium]